MNIQKKTRGEGSRRGSSTRWMVFCCKWQRRKYQRPNIEGEGSGDNESAEQWKTTKIHTFLENFCSDDLFNADETGLYYRATPDGSLCYKHIALSGYKKAMERIAV
ncbi:hypothetical protein RF11_16253 [Thelohanellus kitauei]|uniref:Uncharacterized protein n=1 Tax=Thelohanellus kitauei TaxID=669202 RepID=A0A0C2MSL5_THEKT|nr:hypothetical protein RF11_16253 [Thelohanellus kitauei]